MKKFSGLSIIIICLLVTLVSHVSADQEGNDNWCNIDSYGCWVTNEDNGKDYLMFWSESARQYFMGDSTPPYTNVVDYSAYIGVDKMSMNQSEKTGTDSWQEALADTYKKYDGVLFTSEWAANELRTVTKIIEKNIESGHWKEQNAWNYIAALEDKYEKMAEKLGD
ncbi:MAG: hypothetical protein IJI57_17015 [Flexilinea sp.]|nr:hypothetical protein [Flexilinea sp.]